MENLTLDEQISFCEEKSKNIKLKTKAQTFVDIKNSLEKLKNPWIPVSERLPDVDEYIIVSFENPDSNDTWGWRLVPITECYVNREILLWVETELNTVECRVIGNIFDNPELLEVVAMTKNEEIISILKHMRNLMTTLTFEEEALDAAIHALNEVERYRAIGTPEECLRDKDFLDFLADKINPNDFETYLRIYNSQDKKGGGVDGD